jgi:hypothetical protein
MTDIAFAMTNVKLAMTDTKLVMKNMNSDCRAALAMTDMKLE